MIPRKLRALCAFVVAWLAITLFVSPGLAAPLRLWHAQRDDEEKALLEIIKAWTGGQVDVLALPHDAYESKLRAAISLGDGPDLFIDSHNQLGNYRSRNMVSPVGDAYEGDDAFDAPAARAVKDPQTGEAWAVPLSQKCVALFVNDGLVSSTPKDLEGIAELGPSLPKGVYPLAYEALGPYAHAAIFGAFGGELLTKDDQFGFFGKDAEASLAVLADLLKRGALPADLDGALVNDLFRSGKAAFVINGPWFAAGLANIGGLKYHVEVLPILRANGQPMRPLLTVESVMLSPTGAAKPEARALARHLAASAAAAVRMRVARAPTARRDTAAPEGDLLVSAFLKQAKQAIPMPSSLAMGAVWEPAEGAIRKVADRDSTPEVALSEAKRQFDDVRRPLPERRSPSALLIVTGIVLLGAAFFWLRKNKPGDVARDVRKSLPAYGYLIHAVAAVALLVVMPLVVGAFTAFFAGQGENERFVGLANFGEILTARGGPLFASGSFYLVLLVTLLWTFANLALHVTIGVALALLLSKPTLKLKGFYRVLLIVPWAVPSYITALSWKAMFQRQFGAMTGVTLAMNDLFGLDMEPISWFSSFSTAFAANLATNVWLGFPFMMVVTLGALTAVPEDALEAAEVDGATRWQRLWLVTLPIIRPTLAPSVTLGGIWTFNMFNVVFLVSGGRPNGTTDILVSEAYRWAFTRQAQYGYAAAYSVLIFFLLFGFTRLSEWRKKRAEEAEKRLAALDAANAEPAT